VEHFQLESLYRGLDELEPCNRGGNSYQNFVECFREVLDVIALEQPDWAAQVQPLRAASAPQVEGWLKDYLAAGGEEIGPLAEFALEQTVRRYWRKAEVLEDGPEGDECPACGARADVAYLDKDGFRYAVCSRCDSRWMVPRILCLQCGEKDAKNLEYFPFVGGYRLYHCKTFDALLPAVDLREEGKLDLAKLRAAGGEMQLLFEEQQIAED
jgi:FdhE protein